MYLFLLAMVMGMANALLSPPTANLLPTNSITVQRYIGSQGFSEITDWQYFDEDNKNVAPPPFDPRSPKRTVESSGSVVRLFSGVIAGVEGQKRRSRGEDIRVLIKEFDSSLRKVAANEASVLTQLESENSNNNKFFVPLLGRWEALASDFDKNEWFRYLKTAPPLDGVEFLVFEYAGLATVGTLATPPELRRSRMPPKRGFLGPAPPPNLPPFQQRASYTIAIIRQALSAVASLHEAGFTHNSISSSSIVLNSVGQDKNEASGIYAVDGSRLKVMLGNLGFASRTGEFDAGLRARAKIAGVDETSTLALSQWAIAEDLFNLGFSFLELVLGNLATGVEIVAIDASTLQRQFDIMDNDFEGFRDYVGEGMGFEEAIRFLGEGEAEGGGGGWLFLSTLLLARESVAKNINSKSGELKFLTARALMSMRFLN